MATETNVTSDDAMLCNIMKFTIFTRKNNDTKH